MPEQENFQRQVAFKLKVSDILNSDFVKDETSAGYVRLDGKPVYRVNIIATVVQKAEEGSKYSSAVIDDGSGRISLRSFEDAKIFSKVDIGDVALVIGKIRNFNNENYILPEIIKKLENNIWMQVRQLELKNFPVIEKNPDGNENKNQPLENNVQIKQDFGSDVYSMIKKLDSGDGALIDEVIKQSNKSDAEEIIKKMLLNGDVFEVKPGRLKVLE